LNRSAKIMVVDQKITSWETCIWGVYPQFALSASAALQAR